MRGSICIRVNLLTNRTAVLAVFLLSIASEFSLEVAQHKPSRAGTDHNYAGRRRDRIRGSGSGQSLCVCALPACPSGEKLLDCIGHKAQILEMYVKPYLVLSVLPESIQYYFNGNDRNQY